MDVYEKLRILAEGAKYDVSCSTSGVARKNVGRMGNASCMGICHSWSADGRCISLLKVLLSNNCVYNCEYCVNRRTAEVARASFEPEELANLTMEFYRRNYIEGLFLSSAVEGSPDQTAERMLRCLVLLREVHCFAGYIHAKVIPGVSSELVQRIGMVADRLSVNVELPSSNSLHLLAPQKKAKGIFTPMRQITETMEERAPTKRGGESLFAGSGKDYLPEAMKAAGAQVSRRAEGGGAAGPSVGRRTGGNELASLRANGSGAAGRSVEGGVAAGRGANSSGAAGRPAEGSGAADRGRATTGSLSYLQPIGQPDFAPMVKEPRKRYKEKFAPAGQTTQMIIGASPENDRQILKLSEELYRNFRMKRVYFSAYVPVRESSLLPALLTVPPLKREHRLYQADWLLRFYGYRAEEVLDESTPFLDPDLDPKICWALRHLEQFPMEINKASMEELLRIPGVGQLSARRILSQRRIVAVKFDDLKKIGVVVKRARFFITCCGRYYGSEKLEPEYVRKKVLSEEGIRSSLLPIDDNMQISMFGGAGASLQGEAWAALTGPELQKEAWAAVAEPGLQKEAWSAAAGPGLQKEAAPATGLAETAVTGRG